MPTQKAAVGGVGCLSLTSTGAEPEYEVGVKVKDDGETDGWKTGALYTWVEANMGSKTSADITRSNTSGRREAGNTASA